MEHSFQFSPPKFCVLPLSQECPMSLLIPQSNFVLCEFHHARSYIIAYRVVQRGESSRIFSATLVLVFLTPLHYLRLMKVNRIYEG